MSGPNILNAQMPVGSPFLETDGLTVSQPWLFYFLSLGKRTSTTAASGAGGGMGISAAALSASITTIQDQVTELLASLAALNAAIETLNTEVVNVEIENAFGNPFIVPVDPVVSAFLLS